MPRYDNFGQLDSRVISSGDTAFVSMNNRLRPDQLQPGQLAYSQNGRMGVDGAWQVRKGINQFGQILSSTTTALSLPFYLYEDRAITAAARVNTLVTVDFADDGWTLTESALNEVHKMSFLNSTWTASGAGNYTASLYVKPNGRTTVLMGKFNLLPVENEWGLGTYTLSGAGTATAQTGNTASITALVDGWYRISLTRYFSGTPVSDFTVFLNSAAGYAGDGTSGVYMAYFQIEKAQSVTMWEPTYGTAGSVNLFPLGWDLGTAFTASGTSIAYPPVTGPAIWVSGSLVGIYDISGTVDPTGNRAVTPVTGSQFTFTIPGATGSESYVLGGTPLAGSPRLEGSINAAYGSCKFSDPSNDNAEYIIEATYDKAVAISLADGTATDIDYPSGVTISTPVNMIQAFTKVFIFRDGATALEWNGSLSGTPAFAAVSDGTYPAFAYLDSSNNSTITDGVVTVTQASHGLSVGDKIVVINNGNSSLSEDMRNEYTIATVPNANTFTFFAQVPDDPTDTIVYGKPLSQGRGFTRMPAPPWGVYHQRRLLVPFFYTTTGTPGSATIADRNVRDEFLFSDIFDANTYDQLQNQFRVTAGIADYLQWIHPFTDDNAVAFNRNSIHLISGLSGSLTDVTIKEITREAGLVAQKSVVTIGNRIFFLSDSGIYATEFGDLYNLRGAGLPLSEAIDPVIKRINTDYAKNAIAIYHDNRYWIAVPLDNSTVNNALLVYNLLNGGWESVDIVDSDSWDIANLISAGAGEINKLYAVNRFGSIHILDNREDDVDYLALFPGVNPTFYDIGSYATTRQYTMGTTENKKFNQFTLSLQSSASNASNGSIVTETEDIDSVNPGKTVSELLGSNLGVSEEARLRGRIGNTRGYGLQLTFTPTQGRPKLRMVQIDAIPGFRSVTQAS